jgi:hypothetical protein
MGRPLRHPSKSVKYYKYTQLYLCVMATVVAAILLKGFGLI